MPLTLHPRHRIVETAKIDLLGVILEWRKRHDITFIEAAQILVAAVEDELRYALRMERHGTTTKKADEAESPAPGVFDHLLDACKEWGLLSDDRGAFRAILMAASRGMRARYVEGRYSEEPFASAQKKCPRCTKQPGYKGPHKNCVLR